MGIWGKDAGGRAVAVHLVLFVVQEPQTPENVPSCHKMLLSYVDLYLL
jgi:hypothetical protein